MSIPGKVHGRIVLKGVEKITECRISEEQGGGPGKDRPFLKLTCYQIGWGCVEQVFTVYMVVKDYIAKKICIHYLWT